MPIYDYRCECGMTAEKKHSITVRPVIQCICGKVMVQQRLVAKTDTASAGKEPR